MADRKPAAERLQSVITYPLPHWWRSALNLLQQADMLIGGFPRSQRPGDVRGASHPAELRFHADQRSSDHTALIGLIRETGPHVVSLVEVDEPSGMPSSLVNVADSCGMHGYLCRPSSSAAPAQPGDSGTRC